MRTRALLSFLAVGVLWGCVSGGSSSDRGTSSDRNLITFEELQGLPQTSAHEAVRQLRPAWLRSRAATLGNTSGRTPPVVFLDNRPYGALVALYDFGSQTIQEIRFIPASDATIRYGTGYSGGIINVISRRWPTATPSRFYPMITLIR